MPDEVPIWIAGSDASHCLALATELCRSGLRADAAPLSVEANASPLPGLSADSGAQVLVLLARDATEGRRLLAHLPLTDRLHLSVAVMLQHAGSQERAAIIASGADDCLSNEIDSLEIDARVRRLARVAALSAEAAQRRDILHRELDRAQRIQQFILPLNPPQVPGLDIVVEYLPAAVLGGDFFDIIRLDEQQIGFFMADVVGHGVGAALNTMLIKSQLVIWARPGISVCETLGLLNNSLSNLVDLEYATALYGVLDMSRWTLEYALAGHPNPLFIRPGQGISVLQNPTPPSGGRGLRVGLPLGMFNNGAYVSETIELRPDDRVLFYTDGLIDWRDEAGDRLGIDGLRDLLGEISDRSLGEQMAWLMHRMRRRGGSQAPDDDVNLVAFGRTLG